MKPSSLYPGSQAVNGLLKRLMAAVKQGVNQGDMAERLKMHKEIEKTQTLLDKPPVVNTLSLMG